MNKEKLIEIVDLIERYMTVCVEYYNLKCEVEHNKVDRKEDLRVADARVHCVEEDFSKLLINLKVNKTKNKLWIKLIETIDMLCKSNAYTGFWDRQRGELRKMYDFCVHECSEGFSLENDSTCNSCKHNKELWEPDEIGILERAMTTERNSRSNCEGRAKYRTIIDETIEKLVKK